MTDKHMQEIAKESNMEKDPADWVTGDEPMTGAQKSYLKTLSEEAKQPFDETLSKADASRRIDELQSMTGRGAKPVNDEPPDEGALESLGRAVTAPVLAEEEQSKGRAQPDDDEDDADATPASARQRSGRQA